VAASDLAALADVKTWLAGSSGIGTTDDALLTRLITDISGAITAYLGRPFLFPRTWTERLDGNGKQRLWLRNWPVTAITSLAMDAQSIPAAPLPGVGVAYAAGYLLELWDGTPPGRLQALDLRGHYYRYGRQNVVITYTAGNAVSGDGRRAVRPVGKRRRRDLRERHSAGEGREWADGRSVFSRGRHLHLRRGRRECCHADLLWLHPSVDQ
jgi:hypothetical protein